MAINPAVVRFAVMLKVAYIRVKQNKEVIMKLYASTTSPYARKVRIALIEHSLPHEFIAESPSDPSSHAARLNPLGKVPLLQRDDGEVLFNSPMIVEYIDSLAAEPLIPSDIEQRWQVQRWHALGDGIADAVVARMLEGRRDENKQDQTFIARQEYKIAASLDFASEHLPGGEYLFNGYLTMADIALAVALDYTDLRYPNDWRAQHPALAGWLATITQRPSFQKTLP
jgi:glutathione S-transferase